MTQTNISLMHQSSSDLMMYVNQPPPMGYTHLMEVMVTVYGLLATFGLVPRLHWMAPIVNIFLTLFFYGFYCVALHMFDPFDEGDHFGFDTRKFYDEIRTGAEGIEALVPTPLGQSASARSLTDITSDNSSGAEGLRQRSVSGPASNGVHEAR